ncbi:MAG: tetratricopeptide repeat protein [Candidatus Sulfotelmatobacter sp.]
MLPLLALPLQSQDSASLYGTVRDAQGKPFAGATIRLQVKDTLQAQTAPTDSQGNYRFVALHGGVYILRARMVGYSDAEIPSLFLGPNEAKNVDLTLLPSKPLLPARAPEFFDQPQFTVAGVTDTTNLGGHGSDTIVRARESLAKETVSLGKSPAGADATAVSAEKSLREAVEHDSNSPTANHRLGKILIENGKAREAIPYLERAAELKPGNAEIAYDLALANARAGNYERARDRAQALLAQSSKAELHHLLGDVQEKLGNSLEAVREYQRAAELDPSEAYLFDWGSELLLHHAPEPALDVFTKGNHLFPQSLRMLIGLGAAWFAQGSYERAAQRICEASDLDPDNSIPYVFLGKMLNAEPTPSQDVVEKLHRFVAHRPEDAAANYYYAVALWKLRKGSQDMTAAAQVEALLKKAVQFDPKFGAAYLELGTLHFEQKDNPSAIADYQHAIEADPQMEEAHYRLAQAYRQHGDTAKAAAELKVYDQIAKESARQAERERHEIRQFVYTLRDQPPAPNP